MSHSIQKASELAGKQCKPLPAGTPAYTEAEICAQLAELPGWEFANGEITRTFSFKDYYQTTAFANAVAWVSHQTDHHPDMEVGYNRCRVRYSTHSIGGISENDFICAAKVSSLGG
jgi:4a-hydroxytetrahydrobiopterin dehydratase